MGLAWLVTLPITCLLAGGLLALWQAVT